MADITKEDTLALDGVWPLRNNYLTDLLPKCDCEFLFIEGL